MVKETLVNIELIGKYINHYMWSDVEPLGKIVGVKGKSTVVLARVSYERDESVNINFIQGGFAGHCTNNHSQKWLYTVNEKDTFTVRLGKAFLKRNRIQDTPYHFYDYNF